jgi:hypothetical protein
MCRMFQEPAPGNPYKMSAVVIVLSKPRSFMRPPHSVATGRCTCSAKGVSRNVTEASSRSIKPKSLVKRAFGSKSSEGLGGRPCEASCRKTVQATWPDQRGTQGLVCGQAGREAGWEINWKEWNEGRTGRRGLTARRGGKADGEKNQGNGC